MSRQTPFPPSPGLPSALYSGMTSLQISQAGPGSIPGTPSQSHSSQPQKALLKGPKTTRHQSRKSEHPSSSTPWKDPPQTAAASSGHMRTRKDDVSYRQIQACWSPFPPDTRAITCKEDDIMVRAAANHIGQTRTLGNQMYEEKLGDAERRVTALEASAAERMRIALYNQKIRRDREQFTLWCIETAPNEELRQFYKENLEEYRAWDREDAQRLRAS